MNKKNNIESIYELSPMQQGMLFHSVMEPDSGAYVEQMSCVLRGPLNVGAFEQAWQRVAARHSILRTSFTWKRVGQTLQVVSHEIELKVSREDWTFFNGQEQAQRLEQYLEKDRAAGFELSRAPLMRLALMQTAPDRHVFVWSHHHLLLDGWSVPLLLGEVLQYYEATCKDQVIVLPEPRPYRDYIAWIKQQDLASAEQFWRSKLSGLTTPTHLGIDRGNPENLPSQEPEEQNRYRAVEFHFSREETEHLTELTRKSHITMNTLVQAAWAILLSRYSGEKDVLFGATVSGRPPELRGSEQMVGLFINTLPVRIQLDEHLNVQEWLESLQMQQAELHQYEYSPLVQVQSWSDISHGQPMFDTLLVYENYPVGDLLKRTGQSLAVEDMHSYEQTNYPITLAAGTRPELGIKLQYDTRRFTASSIDRLLTHFKILLKGMANAPQSLIRELPMLSPAEQVQVLVEWNNTTVSYPAKLCAHQLFEAQAEQTPGAIALISQGQRLTYRELNEKANRLAHHLKELGAGPDKLVAICAERSAAMVIGLLGILKAGAAYLPLDPNHPPERLKSILQDSQAAILLTQPSLHQALDQLPEGLTVLDQGWTESKAYSSLNLACSARPHNLAYVIYTSGTTGHPKGVMVEHRSLVNLMTSMIRKLGLSEKDRVLQSINLTFDASVQEIFPSLASGAALILADPLNELSGRNILDTCKKQQVTLITLPTSIWHQCVEELQAAQEQIAHSIRAVVVGGDKPLVKALETWSKASPKPIRFFNAYGPTEATVTSTMYEVVCRPEKSVDLDFLPIGRPVDNSRVYILNKDLQPVPLGVTGQICVAGANVARGYLNYPDMTAEKFVPEPFPCINTNRMYLTGDLGRYLPDGNIEFIGRADHQIKIRGFRIEPGEIEAALQSHPWVRESLVIAKHESNGSGWLAAYVVGDKDGQEASELDLRNWLHQQLPDYMVPRAFVKLERMPLTSHGKIDRKALPEPLLERSEANEYIPPRSPEEEVLAGIWSNLLGVQRVSMNDNFFELGGHSLLAMQLVSRVRETFKVEVGVRNLFESGTIPAMIGEIQIARKQSLLGDPSSEPFLVRNKSKKVREVSFAQERLWFIDQLEPGNLFYNLGTGVRIHNPLDAALLQSCLDELSERHEILRTRFEERGGRPVQIIEDQLPIPLEVIDLQNLPAEERDLRRHEQEHAIVETPYDLHTGPLLRLKLLQLGEQDQELLIGMHHVITDGWSMEILVDEIGRLYDSHLNGQAAQLDSLKVQYADYAEWQRSWMDNGGRQKLVNFWKEQLKGLEPILDLPVDHPRPAMKTPNGATYTFNLDPELVAAVRRICREENLTAYMVLLAAYEALLYRYSGQEDFAIGTAIASRTRSEVEPLIGYFANTLVMRADLRDEPDFRELLKRVRTTAMSAYTYQDMPFEMLVEELQPERNLSYTPIFQVGFDLQWAGKAKKDRLNSLKGEGMDLEASTAPIDLLLSIADDGDELNATLVYSTDLFEQATIARMMDHYCAILRSLTSQPEQKVCQARMLSEQELQQITVEWNATGRPFPENECIHERFERMAAGHGQQEALVFEGQSMSYAELERKSNQLARWLNKQGIGPELVVGVMMERGMDVIISILGTLKSGGAFLPLDPRYPSDRLQFMIEDSGVSLILSQKKLDGIVSTSSSRIVFVDEIQHEVSLEDDHGLGRTSNPDNLAYMIYTSGSTGNPKGARLGHRGLNNLSEWQKHAFNITAESRVLQFSPLSFDASVWEIFMALGNGACLVLAPQDRLASGVELVRLLQQERVSTVTLPPSMLAVMPEENLPDLKTVIAAGEACSNELVNKWGHGRQFVDAYGPTETTVCATAGECTFGQKEPPSIGRPIDNAVVYILDVHQQVVPVGVKGELYVGGAGLARGYWKRDELTAEKFVANPLPGAKGDRLYRTGDLVKYRADGQIDFLGRIDNQVKLRGFRIELGEIEAALRGCEGVSDATVIVREDVPGIKRLVGYVVAAELSEGWEEWFRASLRTRLPEYMVPPVLMRLEALPLSPSGKVNRKALPAPDMNGAQRDRIYSAPRDEVEKDLARIYEDLLGIERAGVTDNFFELGGHSLLATQLISRVRETFEVELPLRTLFEAPSLADLASQIKNSQKEETLDVATVEDLIKEFSAQSTEDIERVLSQGDFFDGIGRN